MSGEEEGEAAEAAVEEGASACKADSEVEWISHFAGVVFEEEELVAACWCLRGGRDLEGGLLGGRRFNRITFALKYSPEKLSYRGPGQARPANPLTTPCQ